MVDEQCLWSIICSHVFNPLTTEGFTWVFSHKFKVYRFLMSSNIQWQLMEGGGESYNIINLLHPIFSCNYPKREKYSH